MTSHEGRLPRTLMVRGCCRGHRLRMGGARRGRNGLRQAQDKREDSPWHRPTHQQAGDPACRPAARADGRRRRHVESSEAMGSEELAIRAR
jgi:hypothetical protein